MAEERNFGLKRKTNKQTNKKHATSWFPETYLEQKHRKESERVDSRFGKITATWCFGLGSQRSEVVQRHRRPGASTRLPGAGRLAGPGPGTSHFIYCPPEIHELSRFTAMLRTPKLRFGGDKTICQRSRSQAAVAEGRSLHGQALGWPPTPRKPETRAPGGTVPLSRLPSSCDTVLKSGSPPSSGRFCHDSMATLLRRGRSSSQVQGPARVPACVTEDSHT